MMFKKMLDLPEVSDRRRPVDGAGCKKSQSRPSMIDSGRRDAPAGAVLESMPERSVP
jgi:hypothetical protein